MGVMADAVAIKVYRDSVPAHCQVATDEYTVAVDYLDSGGNIITTMVHDRAAVEGIAEAQGLSLEDHYVGDKPKEPVVPTGRAATSDANAKAAADDDTAVVADDAVVVDENRPSGNASAEEWRAYRLSQGRTPDEVDNLGRNELRDLADPS